MSTDCLIIPTGTANLASVAAFLRRAGLNPRPAQTPDDVRAAPRLVLPGVGTFAAGMATLTQRNFAAPLRQRLAELRPTLAICLGLQLLYDASDESPGVSGLGILPGVVRRFDASLRVPHMGWNLVTPDLDDTSLPALGHAYFANSFHVPEPPTPWRVARSTHGVPFIAAIARGPVLATQFHPELSGEWGQRLLAAWIARSNSLARTEPVTC